LSEEAFAGLVDRLGGSTGNEGTLELPVKDIEPDPEQPRRDFSDQELDELAASIRDLGILQPIVVRPHPGRGGRYMVVMGERRWRAASKAGRTTIPAIVREIQKKRRAQLVENLQRENLGVMEIARALRSIVEESRGESQAAIARAIGKDRAYVTRYLKMLELLPELQQLLDNKRCNDMQVLLALDQFVRAEEGRRGRLKRFLAQHPDFALSRTNLSSIQTAIAGTTDESSSKKPVAAPVQNAIAHLRSVTGVEASVTRKATELRIRCKTAAELARVEAWLAGEGS
jgi:ParB/RepB/Spo0J family partition protein